MGKIGSFISTDQEHWLWSLSLPQTNGNVALVDGLCGGMPIWPSASAHAVAAGKSRDEWVMDLTQWGLKYVDWTVNLICVGAR